MSKKNKKKKHGYGRMKKTKTALCEPVRVIKSE